MQTLDSVPEYNAAMTRSYDRDSTRLISDLREGERDGVNGVISLKVEALTMRGLDRLMD